MSRLTVTITSVITAVLALPVLAVAGLGGGTIPSCTIATTTLATATDATATDSIATAAPAAAWDAEQRTHARTIVAVGRASGAPPRGWVIAVAAAMQESGLRNLPPGQGDRDSVGLLQQRPSQGWGTPAQLADPAYQAQRFYQALQAVPNWQQLPLTIAAQAVQRSAHPDAYARWTNDALTLVTQTATGLGVTLPPDLQHAVATSCLGGIGDDGDGLPVTADASMPAGFTVPAGTSPAVGLALMWALAQRGTPYSYGGDCTAPHDGDPAHQCDCSSLVQIAYRHAGIDLPRTTLDQVHAGVPVPSATQLLPGDLVFIAGSDGSLAVPRHVGLYLGAGLIVHAPKTGDHVKVSHLDSWGSLAAIRRIITTP